IPSAHRQDKPASRPPSPYAPITEANWMTGVHGVKAEASVIHGKPVKNQPRKHSIRYQPSPSATPFLHAGSPLRAWASAANRPPYRPMYAPMSSGQGAASAHG